MLSRDAAKRHGGGRSSRFSRKAAALEMLEGRLLLDGTAPVVVDLPYDSVVDLIVSGITLDERSVYPGQTVTVEVATANYGESAALPTGGATGFQTALFLRDNAPFDRLADEDVEGEATYASLAALTSVTTTFTIAAPTTPGRYRLAAMADRNLNVDELNTPKLVGDPPPPDAEANNWAFVDLYVHQPPEVTAPIADIDVLTSSPATELDLTGRFNDPDITGTVYRFTSNLDLPGAQNVSFDVHMFDTDTPITVTNFRAYADDGDYVDSIIHRSIPGFIVQGGGFAYDPVDVVVEVTSRAPILNEPVFSNIRGTIAMAKVGADPPTPESINSATSGWFVNLDNNGPYRPDRVNGGSQLDTQNGGFTAFGEVIGTGMDVPDAIAAQQRWNFGQPFDTLPLVGYENLAAPVREEFILFTSIETTDPLVFDVAGNTNEALVTAVIAADGTLTLTYAPDVNGTAEISIRATDLAGGTVTETFEVVVHDSDVTAPVVTVDPLTTYDATPPLTGTVDDPAATVEVTVNARAYDAVNNGDGTWTLTDDTISPALGAGTYNVQVAATDPVGNVGSDATTDELTVALTPAPNAPDLLAGSDSGALSDDNITMLDNSPAGVTLQFAVSGVLPGATVTLYADGAVIGSEVAAGTTVTITTNGTVDLVDGVRQITARQGRQGELGSTDSAPLAITVDTVAPVVSIDPLTTNQIRPSLLGRVDEVAATVTVTVDGQTYDADNYGNTWWGLAHDIISPPLGAGAYDVLAEATDPAGNVSVDATTDELVITPTSAPNAPDLLAGSDSGALNDDDLTMLDNSTPAATLQFAVSGVLDGATVTLYADGVVIGSAVAAGTTVTITTNGTADLADGVRQITARQCRPGELVSADSAPLAITVDTVAPVISIDPLTTNQIRPSLLGRVNDAAATVTVTVDSQAYDAVNHGNTWWRLANNIISPPLGVGAYDVLAEATDSAGNVGVDATTDELTITLTSTPNAPDLLAGSDSGMLDDDDITMLDNSTVGKALQFTVSGTLVSSTVTIYADGVAIGSAVASGPTVTVTTLGTVDLADGVRQITARQRQGEALESTDSAALAITVDTVAPTASVPVLAGDGDGGVTTPGIDPQFDGTADDAGSGVWKVDVRSDDGKSGIDDAAPFYSVTLETLNEGSRVVTAKAYDVAGNTFTTGALVLTVDRSPTVLTWDGTDGADWTSAHWNDGPVAPAGGEVMVVNSGTVIVSGDLTVTPGAATSLAIAGAGTVSIATHAVLVAGGDGTDVSVATGGTLNVDGRLLATTVNIDGGHLGNSPNSARSLSIGGDVLLRDGATLVADAVGARVDTLVADAVTIQPDSSLEIVVSGGGNEFQTGAYTLIQTDPGMLDGTFTNVTALGGYVSVNGNGLTYDYTAGTVTLTLDKDLNPADANLDGQTDVSDRIAWNNNNFKFGTTFATGDWNNDGRTDVSDRIIWNNNNFTFATAAGPPQAAPQLAEAAPAAPVPDGDADAMPAAYHAQTPAPARDEPSGPGGNEAAETTPPVIVEPTTSEAPTIDASSPEAPPTGAAPSADADAPPAAELEPDLSAGLTDPLG